MSNKKSRKIVRNIRKTYKNKLMVLGILALGAVMAFATEDGTFLVFALIFFGPLFFAKDNYIN